MVLLFQRGNDSRHFRDHAKSDFKRHDQFAWIQAVCVGDLIAGSVLKVLLGYNKRLI